MMNLLTETKIKQAKPAEKAYKLFDGGGLFLLVTPHGQKWWRFKYRFADKEKLLSLGVYPGIGLKQARERRDDGRRQIGSGIDPSTERHAVKASQTAAERAERDSFEAVAREWFEKFSPNWVPEHAVTVIHRLEADVLPWIGKKPIAEITAVQLLEVLRRIEARGAISTAHRIKQICGQVFRYAIATGRASRDPSADLRGALPPERERHFGALTKPADVAALIRAIEGYQGSFIVRCALKFTALTFARPGEIRKAEWSEIDFDNALWRIPAERMKAGREHLVPLARQTIAILRELHPLTGAGKFLFTCRTPARPMSENAIGAALCYLGYERGRMTAHGFRRMASTLLNESGKWSPDAIERQLAHAEGDEVRAAYNAAEHLQERVRMMRWWADCLDKFRVGGSVIPFRPSASA